eukprot:m.414478 g.414478  ORF g.414478 m.414478 type:complete len:52 (+) comp21271_c0_seq9:1781-1936(+)
MALSTPIALLRDATLKNNIVIVVGSKTGASTIDIAFHYCEFLSPMSEPFAH